MAFKNSALGELLTLRALKPHPEDTLMPLARRFAGERLLCVWVGSRRATIGQVGYDKNERPDLGSQQEIPSDGLESLVRGMAEYRASHSKTPPYVVLLLAQDWLPQVTSHAFDGTSQEKQELLLEEPGKVLGYNPTNNEICSAFTHPRANQSVTVSIGRQRVLSYLEAIVSKGFKVVRVQVPVFSMLEQLLLDSPEKAIESDLVVADNQGYLILETKGSGHWRSEPPQFFHRSPPDNTVRLKEALESRKEPSRKVVAFGTPWLNAALGRYGIEYEALTNSERPDIEAAMKL